MRLVAVLAKAGRWSLFGRGEWWFVRRGGCRLALIHLALEKTCSRGRRDPGGTASKPERISRPRARLAVQAGCFQQLFSDCLGRPFRCCRERGGEDSCGGF